MYYHPEVFELFDDLVKAGKIRFYGVSVERVEEGLKALDYPGVQSVQMVYNISASGRLTCSWPRRAGARSVCWRACRCRRGCWRAR